MTSPLGQTRYCIIGGGAVGCAAAGRLSASGRDVTMVVRPHQAEALRRDGISLTERGQETLGFPRIALAGEIGPQSVILLAVKSQAIPALLPDLQALMDSRTILIPLVNGIPWWFLADRADAPAPIAAVDPGGQLQAGLPAWQILGCAVYTTAILSAPGRVTVPLQQQFLLGRAVGPNDDAVTALAADLTDAGITARLPASIRDEVWTKCALNYAVNPLSVLSGASMGDHFGDPELLPLVLTLLDECWRIGAHYGVKPTDKLDEAMTHAHSDAARRHITSMLSDYRAGRPLELSGICDAMTELGARAGIPTPVGEAVIRVARYRAAQSTRQ